jgi:hypothetical protein
MDQQLTLFSWTPLFRGLPFIGVFGLVPLPGMLLVTVSAFTTVYVVATEITKSRFYRGLV